VEPAVICLFLLFCLEALSLLSWEARAGRLEGGFYCLGMPVFTGTGSALLCLLSTAGFSFSCLEKKFCSSSGDTLSLGLLYILFLLPMGRTLEVHSSHLLPLLPYSVLGWRRSLFWKNSARLG
jgi:hypothetical protein